MTHRSALVMPALALCCFASLAVACSEKNGDSSVPCTDAAVASVQVVVTSATDTSSFLDAAITWSGGGESGTCENLEGTTSVCGWDITGEMTLTATAEGFVEQTQTVDVQSDGCHAITENVTFRMDPA